MTINNSKIIHKNALKQMIQGIFDQIINNNEWELPTILFVFIPKHLTAVKLFQNNKLDTSSI